MSFCAKCSAEVPDGAAFCPKCGNRVTASSAATESAPEQFLMKATDLVLHREKEKPSAFRGEWGTLILTSRRLIFLPRGGALSFGSPKCDTIESIGSALTKQGSFQIPISTVAELKKNSRWGDEYLKVRSQDQTGQKLNLFLAGSKTWEYEWNVKDNKWYYSGEHPYAVLIDATLYTPPRWDVWIQKMNSSGVAAT